MVVENLDFHTYVGRVALERRPDSHTVVAAFVETKLEAKNEIRILLLGVKIPTSPTGADQQTVSYEVPAPSSSNELPAVEALAVEERDESILHRPRRNGKSHNQTQDQTSHLHRSHPHRQIELATPERNQTSPGGGDHVCAPVVLT